MAQEIFLEARAAIPWSLVVGFAYADFLEVFIFADSHADHLQNRSSGTDAALQVYEDLIKVNAIKRPLSNTSKTEGIDLTLVFVQYMRFARRTGDMKAARVVFKKARDAGKIGPEVYVAAAKMELGR